MSRLPPAVLTLVAVACSPSTHEPEPYPVVWSWSSVSGQSVDLRFLLPISKPNCQADSVSVTGPGLSAPLQLGCSETTGAAFGGRVNLGTIGPPPPFTYTFTVTLGSATRTHVATVACYLALPVAIAPLPGDTVTSHVTLTWTRAPATGIEYVVALAGTSHSLMDQSSMVVDLPSGSYSWSISATPVGIHDGTSALNCGSEWDAGQFTVP